MSKASHLIDNVSKGEEQDWPEAGSLWNSSKSGCSSVASILKHASKYSYQSSVKRQAAAADAAASQAVLKVLQEQEREQLEMECLEAEAKRRIAAQEAAASKQRFEEAELRVKLEEEHIVLQRALKEKRRRIQHLEAVKEFSAARARMQVYDQELAVAEESKDILTHEFTLARHPPLSVPPAPENVITWSNESVAELVKVLADALDSNRIPVREPLVFSGDLLKYSDWKLSFQTLIDQKNIQEKEKIYYLTHSTTEFLTREAKIACNPVTSF